MPLFRYSQVNTLPLILRHLPRIPCVQGRQESKWPTGGNGVILKIRTVAARPASDMGLNNQKVYCERRESTKRNKSTMTGMNLINNPKLFKVWKFYFVMEFNVLINCSLIYTENNHLQKYQFIYS